MMERWKAGKDVVMRTAEDGEWVPVEVAQALQDERDALAAHVEVMQRALEHHRVIHDYLTLEDGEARQKQAHEEMEAALVAKPETSLAQLKAKWQADVLSWALSRVRMRDKEGAEKIIGMRLDALTRQAEEASHAPTQTTR